MYCIKCGNLMYGNQKFCPDCGTATGHCSENKNSIQYKKWDTEDPEYIKYQGSKQEDGSTKILVLSILEMICCNRLFGILGLIFVVLAKNKLSNGNVGGYESDLSKATTLLIIGIVVSLLCGCFLGRSDVLM